MAADGASGVAAVGLGLKSGLIAAFAAAAVSVLAVFVGFTVVPLKPGDELRDAARRLAGGLLCSLMLGFPIAFKAIDTFPWLLSPWQRMLEGQHPLMPYIAAAAPFLALTAIPGFWVVAAWMVWFQRRAGKDIGELVADARKDIA